MKGKKGKNPPKISSRRKAVEIYSEVKTTEDLKRKLHRNENVNIDSASKASKMDDISSFEEEMERTKEIVKAVSSEMAQDVQVDIDVNYTSQPINYVPPSWNDSDDDIQMNDGKTVNKCDKNSDKQIANFNTPDNTKPNHNDVTENSCDNVTDKYLGTDHGPYFVHLSNLSENENEIGDIHDVTIGLKMKKLKINGVTEVKKVSRRELKVTFFDKNSANDFLGGKFPTLLGVKAFIPKYNITKTGMIFDIPTKFDEQYLKENLEAILPIVSVYRCQKRKIVNGSKTKEWIPSNTIKVTFRGQDVPDEVTFGFSKRKVKPHVPDVVQCYKCLRFGHISKYCKQVSNNCMNCGTQHEPPQPCAKQMKCFHCHSDRHNGSSKDCPEYVRNKLIKETMYFRNMTFLEANEEFPRTESQFRIAEKSKEFPKLPNRRKQMSEERVEASFPRKSSQDLAKQYSAYVQLNKGSKPSPTLENSGSFSEVISRKEKSSEEPSKVLQNSNNPTNKDIQGDHEEAIDLIHALGDKIQNAYSDSSQPGHSFATQDLLLIELSRMILDFVQNSKRKVTPYHSEGGDLSL